MIHRTISAPIRRQDYAERSFVCASFLLVVVEPLRQDARVTHRPATDAHRRFGLVLSYCDCAGIPLHLRPSLSVLPQLPRSLAPSLPRSLAPSLAFSSFSLALSPTLSPARLLALSLRDSVARSLARSVPRSVPPSLRPSVPPSVRPSLARSLSPDRPTDGPTDRPPPTF